MKTRNDLMVELGKQRQRRQVVHQPGPPTSSRKRNGTLIMIGLVLLLSGTTIFFNLLTSHTETSQPSNTSASAMAMSETPAGISRLISMQVCTNIQDGRMNVHFQPGAGSEIRGYLHEAEAVQVLEQRSTSGGSWLHLVHPIDGWANARLLCPGMTGRD